MFWRHLATGGRICSAMNAKANKPRPAVVVKAVVLVSRAINDKGSIWVAYRVGRSERTVIRWSLGTHNPTKNEAARLLSVLKEYAT